VGSLRPIAPLRIESRASMLRKLALVLISSLVSLLGAEVLLRVLHAAPDVSIIQKGRFRLSANPQIGFFAQRARYAGALDAGRILPPAKSAADMQAVVVNSTVDGVLVAVFLLLVVVVVVNAAVVCVRSVRRHGTPTSSEAPYVESLIEAVPGGRR